MPARFLLFILSLCIVTSVRAQWGGGPDAGKANFSKLKLVVDTISYEGHKIVRQRAANSDLDKYRSPNDRDAVEEVRILQRRLDEKDGRQALLSIGNLRRLARGIDFSLYEAEANAYGNIAAKPTGNVTKPANKESNTSLTRPVAQSPAGNFGGDTAEMVKNYGGMQEFMFNADVAERSSSKLKVLFVGYTSYWYSYLSDYMQKALGWRIDSLENGHVKMASITGRGFDYVAAAQGGNVTVHTHVTVDGLVPVIADMTINGNAAALTKLFTQYWQVKDADAAKLKKGVVYSKSFLSDNVTFDWRGADPVITVAASKTYRGYTPSFSTQYPDTTGTYDGLNMSTILGVYGSIEEYQYQQSIASHSKNERKFVVINHPAAMQILMLMYIRDKYKYSFLDDDGNMMNQAGDNWMESKLVSGDKNVFVRTEFTGVSSSAPARKAKISGEPGVLTDLFLSFWENKTLSKAKLVRGAEISQDFLSDHITFNWKEDAPFITITSNEED